MSKEFERQLKQAMKSMGSGSIPTTDYSMGETFGQMNLQFPQAPSFTMPKPRELGINRDFSGNKMSLYFQNVEKAKGPDMSKEAVEGRNARATDFGRTIGDEMKARREGAPTRSARKAQQSEREAQQSEYARAYGAPTGNSYEDAYNDAVFKMNKSGAGSPMQDEDTNPAPTPSSPLPTGGGNAQPSGGKQPKTPKTPKTPKPSSGGSTPKAPKAPTPQAPQAPTPQAPQAPTPTIPGGGRRSGSRREDAVGDRVRGVKQTTKSTIKPLTKPLTKATTGSSRGATTPDARNPGRRAPKKGRYT